MNSEIQPRKMKKALSKILYDSQNIGELLQSVQLNHHDKLLETIGSVSQGPRISTNQIQSKTGDTGDLFESGTLFQSSDIESFESKFTRSGSILNQFCEHVYLAQEIENKLLEQIKNPSVCKFQNICKYNCTMKSNPAHSSVQKLLLYQLYENQVIKLKEQTKVNKGSIKIIECEGQGCDYYFILNNNLQKDLYYCPLCLEKFRMSA